MLKAIVKPFPPHDSNDRILKEKKKKCLIFEAILIFLNLLWFPFAIFRTQQMGFLKFMICYLFSECPNFHNKTENVILFSFGS